MGAVAARASTVRSLPMATRPSAAPCINSIGHSAAVPYDINGDCTSDILWMNDQTHQFGWWLLYPMSLIDTRGTIIRQVSQTVSVTPGYWIAASGDFNNDGKADLIWTSNSRDLYLWTSNGAGFASTYIGAYPAGWTLVGAADMDGDGYDDLIWENQDACEYGYWLMKGSQVVNRTTISVTCGYHISFIETAYDSPNGTTPAIYWQGPVSPTGVAPTYQWLPQGQTPNASFYGDVPVNWTFVAGLNTTDAVGQLAVFYASGAATGNVLCWSPDFATTGAQGDESLMSGYQPVAAGHFTGSGPAYVNNQEILWANGAGNLVVWMLDTSDRGDILIKDILRSEGYGLPAFPASAGWHVVRPGVQN